jgi:ankyrin repeat protein
MRRWFVHVSALVLLVPALTAAAGRAVPIADAARDGDLKALRALLAQKVNVNAPEPDGSTALHWAADRGDLTAVDLLLRNGANARVVNRYGVTPLSLAADNGGAAVIDRLLKAGADPNTAAGGGETVLMTAARAGRTDAVRVLIEGGANVNTRSKGPSVKAAMGGRIPRVNDPIGLRAHRDPTWAVNNDGLQFTPIMWAAREGKIDAAKALLDGGANVNDEKPGDGTTVLILAILNRHYELAANLLDSGADPSKGPGYTALQQLVWTRRLNAGFGGQHPEPTGTLDSLELARKLIAKGVKINHQATKSFRDGYRNRFNRVGSTAFLQTAKLADVPMMKLLVASGADIHITNGDKDTPLMVAAGVGILNPNEDAGTEAEVMESVKYLLEELHFDVNTINNNGETALHGAAYRGFNEVAGYLIDRGANLEVANVLGWKPITIADGLFYSGFFKANPHTAAYLREVYAKKGLPIPTPPKVNDTTLLTLAEKYKVGDIVQEVPTGGYKKVEADDVASLQVDLFKVIQTDPQSQITATEPYKPLK